MTLTPKHEKLLLSAATSRGVSTGLYMNEARELIAAGLLEQRIVRTAVGAMKLQLFRTEAA
jgi:hypothetical protein